MFDDMDVGKLFNFSQKNDLFEYFDVDNKGTIECDQRATQYENSSIILEPAVHSWWRRKLWSYQLPASFWR